jgi:hypothetical protein
MRLILEGLKAIFVTIIASALLIFLSIIYFGITLWVIKGASNMFFGHGLEANWAVFSSALLATGSILAGALEKKPTRR